MIRITFINLASANFHHGRFTDTSIEILRFRIAREANIGDENQVLFCVPNETFEHWVKGRGWVRTNDVRIRVELFERRTDKEVRDIDKLLTNFLVEYELCTKVTSIQFVDEYIHSSLFIHEENKTTDSE